MALATRGPITPAMRVALSGSLVLFSGAVLVPALLVLWTTAVAAAVALASFALLHAHALVPGTLRVAFAIGVVLACLLASATLRPQDDAEAAPGEETYPAFATLLGLVVIAGLTTLAALPGSAFFPYPLTTIAVTTATTYLALAGVVTVVRTGAAFVRGSHRWASGGSYRAGFLTASFVLLGAGGAVALERQVLATPIAAAADELELADVRGPSGVLDIGPKVLCLGAGEVEPTLARTESAAPACTFLPHAADVSRDQCFERIMARAYKRTTESLDARYSCGTACDDFAAEAALDTCTREPLPDKIEAYFITAARHAALKWAKSDRQFVGSDTLDERPVMDCSWRSDEDYAERLAAVRKAALAELSKDERAVVRLRLRDKSFREVAEKVDLTETKAKNMFHNAMGRLRRKLDDWRKQCE